MSARVSIVGAGSLGRLVYSTLVDLGIAGRAEVSFLDDRAEVGPYGLPLRRGVDEHLKELRESTEQVVLAIASNRMRRRLMTAFPDLNYSPVIHPSAVVSKFASLGRGVVVLPNVSIDPDATIEMGVLLNKNVSIGHNCRMGAFSQASPGCSLGGPIGEGATLGLGTVVLPGVSVGADAIVGAGSVVTRPIPPRTVAFGNPCRPRSEVAEC